MAQKFCLECGEPLVEGKQFCGECGSVVPSTESAVESAPTMNQGVNRAQPLPPPPPHMPSPSPSVVVPTGQSSSSARATSQRMVNPQSTKVPRAKPNPWLYGLYALAVWLVTAIVLDWALYQHIGQSIYGVIGAFIVAVFFAGFSYSEARRHLRNPGSWHPYGWKYVLLGLATSVICWMFLDVLAGYPSYEIGLASGFAGLVIGLGGYLHARSLRHSGSRQVASPQPNGGAGMEKRVCEDCGAELTDGEQFCGDCEALSAVSASFDEGDMPVADASLPSSGSAEDTNSPKPRTWATVVFTIAVMIALVFSVTTLVMSMPPFAQPVGGFFAVIDFLISTILNVLWLLPFGLAIAATVGGYKHAITTILLIIGTTMAIGSVMAFFSFLG